jgi:hypothetical protein
VRLVTRLEGEPGDGAIRLHERPGGALEPQAAMHLERRLTHEPAEDAVEMQRSEARALTERAAVEGLIEAGPDVRHRLEDQLAIVVPRVRLHLHDGSGGGRERLDAR